MRALIQRVSQAAVRVDDKTIGQIKNGLLIFLGVTHTDDEQALHYVAEKCVHLRIFEDENGKMNRSLLDTAGQALVVSQFTLYGDTRKGRRPGFSQAAAPEKANALYEQFVAYLNELGIQTQTGKFGAHMHVEIQNDGPVTLMIENP
ncbi:MAG: D-tyrosyl-tRNA(Tyr) deacylase [Candidatus Latescibacteria bacterium]|nr:D-tyrosyl-tRNA(Tyr) deacylase [Candidatus Latescibacterota bacterium]MBT4137188.1 D-tyrosyl-tRNA(Tyr) deacylase [Candidatus Latescibacterota bacterium]MBT5828716.1 D-tyrosyl-tRNA(Tyr) deacylase [Candidatus Latescibacterota bacterium]